VLQYYSNDLDQYVSIQNIATNYLKFGDRNEAITRLTFGDSDKFKKSSNIMIFFDSSGSSEAGSCLKFEFFTITNND
jgi:hypothetical protein